MRIRHLSLLAGTVVLTSAWVVGMAEGHESTGRSASCDCAIWLPGSGFWSDATRWQDGNVPGTNATVQDILIDGQTVDHVGLPGKTVEQNNRGSADPQWMSDVQVDLNVAIGDLSLGVSDIVRVLDGRQLRFVGTSVREDPNALSLVLDGELVVDGATQLTEVVVGSGASVSMIGSGRVRLVDQLNSQIRGETGNETLTINSGSLEGAGRVGERLLRIENFATIEANISFERLTLQPSTAGIDNAGSIRARDFARIRIEDAMLRNSGGILEARSGAMIDLINTYVQGGRIETDLDAAVRNVDGPATFEDVQIDGNIEIGLQTLTLVGSIVNNGSMYFVGGEQRSGPDAPLDSELQIGDSAAADVILDGTGMIILGDAIVGTGDKSLNVLLINGADHTISGGGWIGQDELRIMNFGTIRADHEIPMVIDPRDGSPFENHGTMHVKTKLFLIDGSFENSGALIVDEGAELFLLPGATLTNSFAGGLIGGNWTVRGSQTPGELILSTVPDLEYNMGSVTLDGPLSKFDRFDSITTNFGTIRIINGRIFTTEDDFTNVGLIEVGVISAFDTTDRLTLNSASVVTLELGAPGQSSASISVNGQFKMDGVLELKLAPGASWNPGTSLDLISATSFAGSFDDVVAPGRVDVVISGGSISFVALPECPGDFDANDQVDVTDLLILLDDWGMCPAMGACQGDLDDSGDVNVLDLLVILKAWGNCPTN